MMAADSFISPRIALSSVHRRKLPIPDFIPFQIHYLPRTHELLHSTASRHSLSENAIAFPLHKARHISFLVSSFDIIIYRIHFFRVSAQIFIS
jgi:hypothetical protein